MGQARRRRETAPGGSLCRDCTLCCSIPEIRPLGKPMYRPCVHLAGAGCGIFGRPERPAACAAYVCGWLDAARRRAPERAAIPHPSDCGAYFHEDRTLGAAALFVDPARPEAWKRTGLVAVLRALVEAGRVLTVFDRGRQMTVRAPHILDALVAVDMVRVAEAEGRPLDIPDYAGRG